MSKRIRYIEAINEKCNNYIDYLKSKDVTNVTYKHVIDKTGEYFIFTRNNVPRSWKAVKIKIR